MAFLRVCSGRFRRDMAVHHARLGRTLRLTRPHRLFARERDTPLQNLVSREVAAQETAVLTVGQFVGGTKHNIIPASAVMRGSLRIFDEAVRGRAAGHAAAGPGRHAQRGGGVSVPGA